MLKGACRVYLYATLGRLLGTGTNSVLDSMGLEMPLVPVVAFVLLAFSE